MVKASGDAGADMVTDLVNLITVGVIPAEQELRTIAKCCKGKSDSLALERGNQRGLKSTDQRLKIAERIIVKLIRQQMDNFYSCRKTVWLLR